jgi:hypothetical protein
MIALPKCKDINVSNELAKTERAREKELWEEAKKMKDKDDSGDDIWFTISSSSTEFRHFVK